MIPASFPKLSFGDPAAVVAHAARMLRPLEQLPADQWAEAHYQLGGKPFSFARTPYLRDPLRAWSSRLYRQLVVMGPAQCGKTEIVPITLGCAACSDPDDALILQTDKDIARELLVKRIDPMLRPVEQGGTAAVAARRAEGGDTTHARQFVGMEIRGAWPVRAQLQMRAARYCYADDCDRIPTDIQKAGHWLPMLEARGTSKDGRQIVTLISSPELGIDEGIEAYYRQGTQKTYRVPCPDCGEYFEASWKDCARFNDEGTADDAYHSAALACSSCGVLIDPRHKAAMVERGVWAGPHQTVTAAGEVDGAEIASSIASYRIDGAIGLASWQELARRQRSAEIQTALRQDDADERAFWNTGVGINYVPEELADAQLDSGVLHERRRPYPAGRVPEGVRLLCAAVDVQGDRFAVGVWGFGDEGRSWLVDRFDLTHLDPTGRIRLKPATHLEHWSVLLAGVFMKRYAVDGPDPGHEFPIYSVAIDTGGADGVAENAYAFWLSARRNGVPEDAITLVKGATTTTGPLIPSPTFVDKKKRGGTVKSGPRFWVINVHRLKNIVAARMRRDEDGPGFFAIPIDLEPAYVDELVAETKTDKGVWIKRQGVANNETWDLAVYAEFARTRGAGTRTDCRWVPRRARPHKIARPDQAPAPSAEGPKVKRRPAARKRSWANQFKD